MRAVSFEDGLAIHGTFPDKEALDLVQRTLPGGKLGLCIADPPYGNIVGNLANWDRVGEDDKLFAAWMVDWTKKLEAISIPGAALYVFGGIGKPADGDKPPFRPFYRYLVDVEHETGYRLSTHITWKKKRAYGIQWGYLFTREELAYFVLGDVKKPRKFTVPLLDTKRGYAGYSEKYPAKSEFLRRTNVWDDITEILKGKTHVNQKPKRLMEIPIEVHTDPGDWVLDPFAGSGTTAHAARKLGRRWIVIEQDSSEFEKMVESMRSDNPISDAPISLS